MFVNSGPLHSKTTMEPQFSLKRHHSHSLDPTPSATTPPSQLPKLSNGGAVFGGGEIHFRLLCPSAKIGGVIGKGGAVIRQLREDTAAKIRIVDDYPTFARCDERVIHVIADSKNPNPNSGDDKEEASASMSVAQAALLKVFERILKVDEERGEKNEEMMSEKSEEDRRENVVCRMLAPTNQVGCVLGRGGKIVEKIRLESGAQVRILPRDQLPACASSGEELIQMTGNFQAVKKALLSVTSCLQEHPKADITVLTDSLAHRGAHAVDHHHSRNFITVSASEISGHNHRMAPEEDVVYRLLCKANKIGSLIGKGGSVVRAIQNETGASIKIADIVAIDSDERVVIVSAQESMDLKHSPAQDAVIRVHSRIAEVAFEPGAAVIARLLVHSQQIGCLLGKGGLIITEMRRLTGASIRIFSREQGLNSKTPNDEVVQVIGSLQSVRDALFQITSRLREISFPTKLLSHVNSSPYFTGYQDIQSPSFWPRHDQASPGRYHSPAGLPHAYEYRTGGQGQTHSSFPHDVDRTDGANGEHNHHHYGGDIDSYSLSFERPLSPNLWHPQAVDYGNPSRFTDAGPVSSSMISNNSESGQMPMVTSVEVVVPQILLPHVYGENKTNLGHITQFSGADVIVYDPNPGATEGRVVISGTPSQLHAAQSLVQAFILCGQAF